MNNWAEGIQRAISHIENHITDDLDISAIAAQPAGVSLEVLMTHTPKVLIF